ncbi:MFS transporter [Thozetella sp. PMI_491]|nr:MFS transporter [Thozetella sp. PMI_491]
MTDHGIARRTHVKDNLKCLVICLCMALSNCQYGYDAGVVASFQAMTGFLKVFGYADKTLPGGWGIDTTSQQLITSFLNVGTIIGVLFAGLFAQYFGRRAGIWLACVVSYIGISVQIGATSIAGIVVGRTLLGASNAFFFTFTNAYVAECSPPDLRSVTSGVLGVMPGIGALIGTVTTYLTKGIDSKLCYQIPLACLFFFPTLLLVIAAVVPESPRWLLVQNRPLEAEKALFALRKGNISKQVVQEEFVEMSKGIEEENALASGAAFTDIFKGTNLRRTIICIGSMTSRASAGLWVFLSYGTYFFQQAGISDPFAIHLYASGAGILATALAIWMGYRAFGRRPLILVGTAGAGIGMMAAAIGGTVAPGTQVSAKNFVAWSIIYMVVYSSTAGMATWPVTAEVVSSRLRVHTLSLATGIDYIFAWLTAFCSPYFINPTALNWGPRYCWIWAGSNALTFAFFYFLLPEMRGRSLEEIDEMFENRVSVRDFPKYECQISRQAHQLVVERAAGGVTASHEVIDEDEKKIGTTMISNVESTSSSDRTTSG